MYKEVGLVYVLNATLMFVCNVYAMETLVYILTPLITFSFILFHQCVRAMCVCVCLCVCMCVSVNRNACASHFHSAFFVTARCVLRFFCSIEMAINFGHGRDRNSWRSHKWRSTTLDKNVPKYEYNKLMDLISLGWIDGPVSVCVCMTDRRHMHISVCVCI